MLVTPSSGFWNVDVARSSTEFGAYTVIATVSANTLVNGTPFIDYMRMGLSYWYKVRQSRPGYTASAYVGPVQGTAVDLTRILAGQFATPFQPTLQLQVTPGPRSYSIAYTSNGIVQTSTDGAAFTAAGASPVVVVRNSMGGGDTVVVFQATLAGTVVTDSVVVPEAATSTRRSVPAVANGAFEKGGPLIDDADSGWKLTGTGTNTDVVYETTSPLSGARSLKIIDPKTTASEVTNAYEWTTQPGQMYGLGAVARVTGGSIAANSCRLFIRFYDSSDTVLATHTIYWTETVATYKQVLRIAPATASYAKVGLLAQNAVGAGDFIVDNVTPILPLGDILPFHPQQGAPLTPPSPMAPTPRLPLVGGGEMGINLLWNGDFQSGDLTGWDSDTDGNPSFWARRGETDYFTHAGPNDAGAGVLIPSSHPAASGQHVMRMIGISKGFTAEQMIPVDANLWYHLEATLWRVASTAATSEYVGLSALAADGTKIQPWHVYEGTDGEKTSTLTAALSGSETQISIAADPTTIFLTAPDEALSQPADNTINEYIALNADATAGAYSDLPNFQTYRINRVNSTTKVVYLQAALPTLTAANGSTIRRHRSGANHLYVAAANYDTNGETLDAAVLHEGSIGPDASSPLAPFRNPNTNDSHKFPAGTKFVRVAVLHNNAGSATATIDYDRFIFRRQISGEDTRAIGADTIGADGGQQTLPTGTKIDDGSSGLPAMKGMQVFDLEHNDAIAFVPAFQNTPSWAMVKDNGYTERYALSWGTRAQADSDSGYTGSVPATSVAVSNYVDVDALTPTGGTAVALLREDGVVLTARTLAFAVGAITTIGGSRDAKNITNVPAYNDLFTFVYVVDITAVVASTKSPNWQTTEIDLDLEYNDSVTGWTVIASFTYSVTATGLGVSNSESFSESHQYAVAGVITNDDFRITVTDIRKTGNQGTGIVASVDPTEMQWDSFSGDPDNYARKTAAARKVRLAFWDANT